MAIKIIVNGKNFRKWETANKQAKKEKEIEFQLLHKFDFGKDKKYEIVTTLDLISKGDLQNEVIDKLDKIIEIREKERYQYFKNDDIKNCNNTLHLINRLKSEENFIKEWCFY